MILKWLKTKFTILTNQYTFILQPEFSYFCFFFFFDNYRKAKCLPLAPIEVEILSFFSLKKKRLKRKAGHYFQKYKIFLLQINCFIITSPLETQNPRLKPWAIAIILKSL